MNSDKKQISGRLSGKNILVVEDEPFIAFDITDAVEDAGGAAVGPAMSVAGALQLLATEHVDGAILDVNLLDGDVGPVIARLRAEGVPFLIHTGAGLTDELRRAYPDIRVFYKPTPPDALAIALAGLTCSISDA